MLAPLFASKFRRRSSAICGFFMIAIVSLVLPEMRSAEPVNSPAGQMTGPSIDMIMQNQGSLPLPTRNASSNRTSTADQKVLRAKLEEMKRDSATLLELASSLKDDVAKSHEDLIAVSTAEKAEKIEKLAKKIKNWAKSN